ncbi:MAG: TRAP transporter TatT component family protein [Desulfocapsaceae bacterium]|nr:TRAP transporter TatT component family protein [Desulfocapsaceae bacterium]
MYQRKTTLQLGQPARIVLSLALLLALTSCSSIMTGMMAPTVDNLQKQTDVDLVCQGAPSYLLMIDSMIAADQDNSALLAMGAKSYSAYVAAMTECGAGEERIQALADKARLYGTALLTARNLPLAPKDSLDDFDKALARLGKSDVPDVFWGAMAWTTWIRTQHGSPASIADSVKVERIMLRLEELDDTYQQGGVHLFLGAYYAAKPQMFGGRPDLSRIEFEKALAISQRSFLLVQTTYADTYARQVRDKALFDGLLKEVVDFPLNNSKDNALSNQIAKRKAKRLLADAPFAEEELPNDNQQ